jgi:hypothetical protein
MNLFFLFWMISFDPAMLPGKAPGRGAMLALAAGAGAGTLLGAWINRDLAATGSRREWHRRFEMRIRALTIWLRRTNQDAGIFLRKCPLQ